jgi:type IV pilus assembly protein PilB
MGTVQADAPPLVAPPTSVAKPTELGALLVQEGVISAGQLQTARALQAGSSPPRKLSQVLIEQRITSDQRIRDAVRQRAKDYRVGELLVLLDIVTQGQLDAGLARQASSSGKRIGEVIVEMGFAKEEQVLRALSYQFDLPYIEPAAALVDPTVLRRVPLAFLRRLEVLPLSSDGKTVTVVTAEPGRPELAAELQSALQSKVTLAVGPKPQILRTLGELDQRPPQARPSRPQVSPTAPAAEDNVVATVDHILQSAIGEQASDIHFEPMANRVRVRFRIDGELVHQTDLPVHMGPGLSTRIKVLCKADVADRRRHQDGRITYPVGDRTIDMRVSIYVTIHGENIVIRLLDKSLGVLPMEKLGMLPALLQRYKESVLDAPSGVVLFTGPTGSGKTTSLYSSVNYCNDTGVKIITVEDPVEFLMDGVVQCSVDASAGRSFADTLREVVRQDPDVIVVGEIRDRDTAAIAIQAALTGHKVLATFHTEDSIGSLIRLVDMNIEAFLICSTVVSSIAQRLARRICQDCREPATPTEYEMRLLGLDPEEVGAHTFYRGAGCATCRGSGYKGRVGLYEMLVLDGDIRSMVLDKRSAQQIRRHALEELGLFTLQEDGIAKALLGLTTLEEVLWHVPRSTEQRALHRIAEMAHRAP